MRGGSSGGEKLLTAKVAEKNREGRREKHSGQVS
jgi:hypothetical protein